MKDKYLFFLLYLLLCTSRFSNAQIDPHFLYGRWVCYKESTADGNVNNALGFPYTPWTDTLEFLDNNKLNIYDNDLSQSTYLFNNGYLILGNAKYLIKIIDGNRFFIQSKSDMNLPLSLEFRYYYCRLNKENLYKIEKDAEISESINLDDYWFGRWLKYKEGNSSGDTLQHDGTRYSLSVDTLEFSPPNKIKISSKTIDDLITTFIQIPLFIGWDKSSFHYGIIDKDHFFLDNFNPNYPEPVVRRHYYRRIE